jgi:para-nitrobenzyl esterase
MVYCYGNLNRDPRTYRYNKSDYELSDIMVKYRTNFAKTGDPNGGGNPEWNLYNPSDAKIIQFDNEVKTIEDPYKDLYPIFDEILN